MAGFLAMVAQAKAAKQAYGGTNTNAGAPGASTPFDLLTNALAGPPAQGPPDPIQGYPQRPNPFNQLIASIIQTIATGRGGG